MIYSLKFNSIKPGLNKEQKIDDKLPYTKKNVFFVCQPGSGKIFSAIERQMASCCLPESTITFYDSIYFQKRRRGKRLNRKVIKKLLKNS